MHSIKLISSVAAVALASLLIGATALAQRPPAPRPPNPLDDQYLPGPDSKPQPGVPQGATFDFVFADSKIFPGTSRKITVYVPAQYRGDKPACVYVGLDSLGFEAPVVFDNLIHKQQMPVTIAIGIASGSVEGATASEPRRYNRSFEFDGLNDNLARFLLEEVFPEVERRQTPGGLPIRLSRDPNDRAAGGGSTGGIGSFTLAWERPDAFRRVFSAIGTYVGMRGGDSYAVLVRKTEPKPIRIFMQDGSNDGLPGYLDEVGDWWMSNQTMQRALQFAGYSIEHVWGEGAHSAKHATAVFPDAMRWLWKDWPQPVQAGESENTFLKAILLAGETWQPAPTGDKVTAALTGTPQQRIKVWQDREYSVDAKTGQAWLKQKNGRPAVIDTGLQRPSAIALSPNGQWLAVAENVSHWGYSYQVQPDGTVKHKQRFYWFHVADRDDDSGVQGWVFDREGRLYAATRMGVQVFDHNGRVRAILPAPAGAAVTALGFGAEGLDTLYIVTADGKAFRRKLGVPGIAADAAPIQLPNWGAG